MEQHEVSTGWDAVAAGEVERTKRMLLYLDDWDPEPADMPERRAAAFADLCRTLDSYIVEHGETVRTIFRRPLHAEIRRRFRQRHGHDSCDSQDVVIALYEECQRHPDVASAEWAGHPLLNLLDRRLTELTSLKKPADPDPDVMSAQGTSDVQALVMLAEQRRALVELLASDSHP